MSPNAIAIVGMAGRFPGAASLSEYWRNLRGGVESIVDLTHDDLVAAGVGEKALTNRSYIRRAALLPGIEEFDAGFFGITPQAARMLDPQHRLFLQTAWHALEDAGYDPAGSDATVGVFATSSTSGYLLHNLMSHYDPAMVIGQGASFDMVNLSLSNDKDHLATRVAYQLNLRGPAMSVQTACSSSLVAVHLACQSILNGECEVALAGGSSIRIPHNVGYWFEPGTMVSPTGHCRPFDIRSDGTIFGSGVGAVVLKSLLDALDDGDRIHAVIRGSALNNDGSTKMNYAAPTAAGQAEVIAEAHAVAEVDASTISYIESHGTGTPLGDPIEIEGLRQAFSISDEDRPGPCYIGSVKSNIGHLETAAGIAGLIKTILCLKHRALPATLHFTSPNPELHLDRGPFVVRGEDGPWEWDGPLRAGVSSFGVGGTNAHVVLEEAPVVEESEVAPGPQVLLLSARTEAALTSARTALGAELSDVQELSLPDAAYTLARRRREPIRLAAVVNDQEDAVSVLSDAENDNTFISAAPELPAGIESASERIVFVFPGQGAQHIGMARGLHDCEEVFRKHFDTCAAAFGDEMGFDLRGEVFDGAGRNLERTDRAQPALFTVEYALAKLAESYGVRPAALAGHSIGEWVAGTLAGVFDLPTAVKAVAMRARLMHASARGVMVAVALGPDAVAEHLTAQVDSGSAAAVDLAAINDPGSCVVAGSEEAIRDFQARLAEKGITARRVRTAHAFHSRLMNPVIPEFTAFLSRLDLREPQIPILSNVTGRIMTAAEATDPSLWARQIRETVRFSDELAVLLAEPGRIIVEVGPGGALTASAMRHPNWGNGQRAVRLMRHQAQNRSDHDTFLLAMGQLWAAGAEVDWTPRVGGRRTLASLPGYPFERKRHWVDYNPANRLAGGSGDGSGPPSDGGAAVAPVTGTSSMEATLQRIWAQCLGIAEIDRNTNFFEVGGDSLIAISVAMTASKEGVELTPQDLYENQTPAALARAINARYTEGSLARHIPCDDDHPPVPPNVSYFLEHGLRDVGSWRVPLVLEVRTDVSLDDIRAVLNAVANHHDALRLRLVDHAGSWDQRFGEPGEVTALATRRLPDGLDPGSDAERAAVMAVLAEEMREHHLLGAPMNATYVSAGERAYLVLSLHGIAGDNASRDILLTDVFTAFAQRLAGDPIMLEPVRTSWRDWLQRAAGLAMHPAVLESRDYWLGVARQATLSVAAPAPEPPDAHDLVRLPSALSTEETGEVDEARRRLAVPIDDLLLAALGRAVAATIGDGALAVELAGQGRSVLRPDVDVRRTVGWFTTIYPVVIPCVTARKSSARQLLDDVAETLKAVPHYGIGYGLLRYLYAPTARLLGAFRPADIFVSHLGTIPDVPPGQSDDAPVRFDTDTALPARAAVPGLGHAIELRVYRAAGQLHVDWWYDTRRLGRTDVESLSRQFGTALLELTRDTLTDAESDSGESELALVELS
jgi:phthiocerol/phenolphthiocerol synthesis type-I polyketide synthase E